MQLYPVIHYLDNDTTLRNAERIARSGCPNVMLIHMNGQDHLLDYAALQIKQEFPTLKIGINRLSETALDSVRSNLELGVDYTWSDHCGIHSSNVHSEAYALRELLLGKSHTFFGSVAFKYQAVEPDPARAAKLAYDFGFIPTTSGAGTGIAADLNKIRSMAEALPKKILGIASGITPENLDSYLPYIEHYLVSTGINSDFHNFNFDALVQIQQKM